MNVYLLWDISRLIRNKKYDHIDGAIKVSIDCAIKVIYSIDCAIKVSIDCAIKVIYSIDCAIKVIYSIDCAIKVTLFELE